MNETLIKPNELLNFIRDKLNDSNSTFRYAESSINNEDFDESEKISKFAYFVLEWNPWNFPYSKIYLIALKFYLMVAKPQKS